MPYLWAVEVDYVQVLRRAELEFVNGLIEKIGKEELPEITAWRRAHDLADGVPNESVWQQVLGEMPREVESG
ncbi:MAG: hypothetical protein LC635_02240, partial [Pseudonocardiaceae bacterium]|nr:hypothetical protein [Pseudonocardiaceae bacterium]